MEKGLCFHTVIVLFVFMTHRAESQVTVQLVSARDRIEGSMLGPQAVYADADRIYLASFQGKLFVLARDRPADFPLLEVVQDTIFPLTAVRGDQCNLYVSSADGMLRVYRKEHPLALTAEILLSDYGLSSLALVGEKIYVAKGQAHLAVDEDFVYLTAMNEGDTALELTKETLAPGMTYGHTFEPNTAVIFDRSSGRRVFGLPAPFDIFGQPTQGATYVDEAILAQTTPGCCGSGIFIFDSQALALSQIIPRLYTNTVVRRGQWLVAGNEGGQIDIFDLDQTPSLLPSSAYLRSLTGHTDGEDIEIRALWMDRVDNFLFAGSSWGNDPSRSPTLPSFFVLELTTNEQGDLDVDGDIDQDDVNLLRAALKMRVPDPSDPRDLDRDGKITARDLRQLKSLCTRPKCVSA
jgi:hypothetical protein